MRRIERSNIIALASSYASCLLSDFHLSANKYVQMEYKCQFWSVELKWPVSPSANLFIATAAVDNSQWT